MSMHLPRVLAIIPGYLPSTSILVVEPLLFLARAERLKFRIRHEHVFVSSSDIAWADVILFCRNTEPAYKRRFQAIIREGKPFVYSLDDNFFEIPLDMPIAQYHRAPERIGQLIEYLEQASLVRVHSAGLLRQVRQYSLKSKLVPAPVNLALLPDTPPKRDSDVVKIVYTTSRNDHDKLPDDFLQDLIQIVNHYGSKIEVHFHGFLPDELKGFPSVKFHRFTTNYEKYLRDFYLEGYDIGLAPLEDTVFHTSKTNNKYREYGACWIAGVYSASEVYLSSVKEGKTGLFASNSKNSWFRAIANLIEDPRLRYRIQRDSRSDIERKYSMEAFCHLFLQDLSDVIGEKTASRYMAAQGSGQTPLPSYNLISLVRRANQILRIRGIRKLLSFFIHKGMATVRFILATVKIQYRLWVG